MGIYSIDNILNEVYFGKNKDIQELQVLLTNIRKDVMANDTIFKKTGNTSDYIFKFNRKCEDIFGFKTFSLNIIYSPIINAMTLPVQTSFDVINTEKNFSPTKNNMKYKKEAGYCTIVFIFSGLLKDTRFTDEEIMAILLHEIGHNFTSSLSPTSAVLTDIKKSILIVNTIFTFISTMNPSILIQSIINFNSIKTIIANYNENLYKNNKQIGIFVDSLNSMIDRISTTASFLQLLITLIINPSKYVYALLRTLISSANPIRLLSNYIGYNDEKLSDDFATIYGYGSELSSGLLKMNYKPRKGLESIMDSINEIIFLPFMILLAPTSTHPDTIVRCKNILAYLEDELCNTSDNKMKKELKSQIDDINKSLDDMVLNLNNYKGDYKIFNKLYSYILYTTFGGDIREILSNNNNYNDIENNYINALNRVEIK